jgi:hypothetical protein
VVIPALGAVIQVAHDRLGSTALVLANAIEGLRVRVYLENLGHLVKHSDLYDTSLLVTGSHGDNAYVCIPMN